MKREKLLRKAINSPQNLRFDELKILLKHFGFQLRKEILRGKGSHEIYKSKELGEVISIQPLKDGKAKDYQVKELINFLRRHNVI